MTELQERVVARLVAAQNARDPAPLRGEDAVGDALALLCEAAPSPEGAIDLEKVAAVCWTFWLRHQGPEDPDAQRDVTIILSTFGFLCPRVPEDAQLPQPLRDAFDPADPAHEARFSYLVSSAYGDAFGALDLGETDRSAVLDRALAWSDAAIEDLPDGHEGFVELAFHSLGLHAARFHLAADPDSLAAAARHAAAVCERLDAVGPEGAEAVAVALGTLVDAARLLGEPSLAEVERLVGAAPDGALPPEAAEGLRFLRELYAQPVAWPGEVDLHVGALIADAGILEHDASRVACAVRRLRAALAHTPTGHPAHPFATAALSRALTAFARERGDEEAARDAVELLASLDVLSEADGELAVAYRELTDLLEDGDPERLRNAGPLLGHFVEQLRERAAHDTGSVPAPDIDLEILDLMAAITGGPGEVSSDERIARYRTALAGLPADQPRRYAYVAVLAALTGTRAQTLLDSDPAGADRLTAEARTLTEEAAADAPADFLPLGLLRRGLYEAALSVAAVTTQTDEQDDAADLQELAKLVSTVSRLDDIGIEDPAHLDSDIAALREMLEDTGEVDPSLRALLAGALGSALSARGSSTGDPTTVDEAVPLLRYARSHAPDLPREVDQILAFALTSWSFGRFDAEAAREASALLATAATEGAPADTDMALLSARTEFFNALGNYVIGHEPGQLERARELASRLKDLTGRAAAHGGDGPPVPDVTGDAMLDLIETIGPGGGPRSDLTDSHVDQCRSTFAACPDGDPMRLFTASTLMRALTQRAFLVRGTDPERSAHLVAEADDVLSAVEGQAPEGWADTMRTFIGVIGQGRLPPMSPSERPPQTPSKAPANVVEAMMAALSARLSGTEDPGALRDPMVPVWFRAHAEIGSAAGALGRGHVDLALSHLEAAVEAMVDVTDRGSDQQTAEHGLTSFEGDIRQIIELVLISVLGRQAAAGARDLVDELKNATAALREQQVPDALPDPAALALKLRVVTGPDVDRAAELLERGRGLLLARRIEARADMGELWSAHPALAREFERLTDHLAAEPDVPGPAPTGQAEWSRLARLRASRELDELIGRIRTQPGFDGFLRPLSAEQLRSLAADGPIVVLNHARRHCHALVVTAQSITALRLEAESDEITDVARRLREAVDAINAHGSARPSPAQLIAAGATMRETLAWTWHTIVRPVLDLVGSAGPVPDGAPWPRVWWVPTGAFNALPLHAAQCTLPDCELDGCGAAFDAVVSSYVPGFQTLSYARTRAEHRDTADNRSALLVASPEEELPGVAGAAGYAAGLLGAREPLVGAAATREAVLAALGSTPWAHFGCHAATDPTEPSGALLHLPSGEPLSVLEICRARPQSARLAFLAACGTARTSERLTDEAVHITSAFLLAGFPAAVGTLWEIDSTHADHVTRDFYRRASGDTADTSAHALHHTVRELRRRIPDRPHVWAAYVHAGS
ncbi:CHAT domain-containing protein [Streptomyces sp. NBC_00038]|uniref:CHAT domain-containing protein n=1 Tax=Streptomyces sp. NBC_00038 TaxID=2903615 RepID=UPI0022530BD9|nr:CHAT domain-containing protein [Streptomyces sp. NBC_00038]MCX5563147.1 CHAT domain-containing protein [Streptomyces sp. NBC_00038]